MANSYTSLTTVMDRLQRHPMLSGLSYEALVDYTVDFMRIVGTPSIFEEKVETIPVHQYAAPLPCDFYEINQVRSNGRQLRSTTDTFHLSPDKQENTRDLTYKIQGGVIFTSFKEGEIEISYQAIKLDEDGYPVIPDNSKFTRALEAYVKKEMFTIQFDMGRITPQAMNKAMQDYSWAVGACENEFQRLTLDKAESFYNSWRTLLIRDHEFNNAFKSNGAKQNLKFD